MIYLMAIGVGVTTIFSMSQNSSLSKKIGLINVTLLNYLTGITTSFIFFLFLGKLSDLKGLTGIHPFAYFGGILGLCSVIAVAYIVRNISLIVGSMLMFTGQIIASFIIDYFSGLSLSPLKMLGVAMIISGIYINNYIDYRAKNLQ